MFETSERGPVRGGPVRRGPVARPQTYCSGKKFHIYNFMEVWSQKLNNEKQEAFRERRYLHVDIESL